MLVKESLDGKRYEILNKPREVRVYKDGKEINVDDIYNYGFEKRLDLEKDIFEEESNEIRTVDEKTVEMNEYVYDGYNVQIYREARVMDEDELELISYQDWLEISSELDDQIRNYLSDLDPNNFYSFEDSDGGAGEYRDDLPGFYEHHRFSLCADAHLDEDGNVHLDGVVYVKRIR